MKRPLVLTALLVTLPVPALAKDRKHVRGCATAACDKRIGRKWAEHHPRAHASSIVAPYRAWLHKLAVCESTDNTHAVSRDGKYRGLYQFDFQTWASVGGSGDPAVASRAEQDLRAVLLLKRRGTGPWPVCG